MKKSIQMLMAVICQLVGVIGAVYVGGWVMLLQPIGVLYRAFIGGSLSMSLIVVCGLKIFFSTTFAGLVWCIGYIGYNYFKGNEDPDWETKNNPHTMDT